MHSFEILSSQKAKFKIDTTIFSPDAISKTVYWLHEHFIVLQEKEGKNICLTIESKCGNPTEGWESVKAEVAQLCSDFQMREVVQRETKDIRTILYLKAFTNIREIMEDSNE